jgi:hypothetical protein
MTTNKCRSAEHKQHYMTTNNFAAENASQIKLGAGLMRKAKPNQTPPSSQMHRIMHEPQPARLPKEATCATVAEGVAFFIRQAIRY